MVDKIKKAENDEALDDEVEFEIEPEEGEEEPGEEVEASPAEEPKKTGKKDVDIEVVDDTPPEDRNRYKSDPPAELTETELAEYSEKVQNRVRHFSKGYHDERRAKERAMREAQELEAYARKVVEENKKLQENLSKGQTALISETQKRAEQEHAAAKAAYRQAYDSGDAEAVTEAQDRLATARYHLERSKTFRAPPSKPEKTVVQREPESRQPVVEPKVRSWADKNTWFGTDDEMTGYALGLHNKLVKADGLDPTSDEYYEKIDSRMREVFPDRFEDTKSKDTGQAPAKKPSVVAPATRSTAPKKVTLTRTQVQIAKRLGVPLELYAKQVAEDMRNADNG